MSLSAKIREQLISSFQTELAEHVQTMTDGLLALEQNHMPGQERLSVLDDIFRAAHSLKGAARAVGATAIEQLAHALESVLAALRQGAVEATAELFTACYQALDAIQAVQAAYEDGETVPPMQALQALSGLGQFQPGGRESSPEEQRTERVSRRQSLGERVPLGAALREQLSSAWRALDDETAALPPEKEPEHQRVVAPSVDPVKTDRDNGGDTPQTHDTVPDRGRDAVSPTVGHNGTIRVSVEKLDALMNQLNELLATKIRAEQQLTQIRQLQELIAQWQKDWLLVRGVYHRLVRHERDGLLSAHRLKSVDALRGGAIGYAEGRPVFALPDAGARHGGNGSNGDGGDHSGVLRELSKDVSQVLSYVGANQSQLHEMQTLINDMSRQYASDAIYMGLVIDDLEQEIKRVRMLPLSTIAGTFGRMVRDVAHSAGKEAVLEIVGSDTELDKQVLEQIKDPLIHLLRNAVDHGVESPAQRERSGKPRVGKITLYAEQLAKNIVIRVSDDGAGLDFDAIRESIARRGVLDVGSLTEADLKETIFQVGVSTSPIITDISGRGVGLDVVRRNVEALRGTVDVSSAPGPGEGTTFTLTLPLRLASSRGLLVRAAGEVFAVPLNNILRIERYTADEIVSLEGQDAITYDGQPLTLARLSDILELPPANGRREEQAIVAVIVAAAERRMAFAVDGLVGEQEMVIKSMGTQLSRVGGIAGATVLGSRQVVLVLNVSDLIKLAMRGTRRSALNTLAEPTIAPTGRAQKHILIVDDSITTRTLEKNILEAAGYVVRLATDGQEALSEIASTGLPDLIVTDVAMPRMNGFELTQRIKQDEQTMDMPVILVTSLDSDEDKAQGIEVGADAYIVKSSFDQDSLLETIEQLP
jgi:two-component system chemotaxis sensor kinase CheA